MLQISNPEESETRVIEAHELKELSKRGWTLVAVIPHQIVQIEDEPVPFESLQVEHQKRQGNYNGGFHPGQGGVLYQKRAVVLQVSRYLVRRPKDATFEELADEAEKARSAAAHAEWEREAQSKVLKEATEKLLAGSKTIEKLEANERTQRSRLNTAETRNQKLEQDIAKIRTAVGELRMREILEGKA
jgi:hypothetical protein